MKLNGAATSLTLSGALTINTGANTSGGLLQTGGTSSITGGSVTTGGTGDLVIRVNGASDELTIASQITGTGGYTKNGAGTLVLSGNNTVTEAFHHGKPMIVLPLFWDQVDNAQRVEETGFGRRLSTYGFQDDELTGAIDSLLADDALAARLAAMSSRIKSNSGTVRAADLIERVGLD